MPDGMAKYRGPEGVGLARETIDDLARHAVPTCPANYEVWSAHRSGANPALSREIEERLQQGEALSEEVTADLFERYFARTRLSVQMVEASAGIAREIADVVASLRGAASNAGSYAGELNAAADDMEHGADPAAFSKIVARLAVATRDVAEHNRKLEHRMEESSRHVEVLQTTLNSVRIEALTDGLTGLANRKHFDEVLRMRVDEENAEKNGLCLLLCDIDHFKRINDKWGHRIGDHVIRFVANVLRDHAAGDFLAARYGGEEFAVIMPRTALQEAHAIAERIRTTIRAKTLTQRSSGALIGRVTISIGIASYGADEPIASLIDRADACLYNSKRSGRDRVTAEPVVGAHA